MKILVTGGAGFIGSHVSAELINQGDDVIIIDNFYQGHRGAIDPEATFIEGDLADRSLLDDLFITNKPDAVMHFASHTLVGESMDEPFLYLRNNIINGLNVLEACVNHGTLKFVLSSTANLFDDPNKIIPITEQEKIVPGSPYGESKAILERNLYWLDQTKGLKYAALRYFNACGCAHGLGEDHSPETHLIPIVLEVAQGKRDKVVIYGDDYDTRDGSCVRDYIHVLDLASAHILALRALDKGSRTYNLGTGNGFSVKEIIEVARKVTGHPIPTEIGPRRAGDPDTLIASSDKIGQELGWKPHYSDLETIISGVWEWVQAHPNGYTD